MLVSHRKKFIFLKTGKTAGTSVELYFEPWCVPDGVDADKALRPALESEAGIVGPRRMQPDQGEKYFSHAPASRVKDWVGDDIWDSYLKFSIVRNPFDKVVSWFHFHMPETEKARLSSADFSETRKVFRDWLIIAPQVPRDRHFCTIAGAFCLDRVLRFETLNEDMESLCGALDIPYQTERLTHRKKGYRDGFPAWRRYYEDETVAVIERIYAWELETFGYSFGDGEIDAAQTAL